MKLNKRLKKVLLEHKGTYIGMVLLIIMSTSVFLGFKTSMVSITQNVADNRINENVEDAEFTTITPINSWDIRDFEKKYDLDIEYNPYIELENGYNNATLKIIPKAKTINLPKLYSGKDITSDKDILLDRYFFDKQNLNYGDVLTLFGEEYTVKGTFTTPNYLSLLHLDTDFLADGSKFGLVLLNRSTFALLPRDKVLYKYSIKFNKDNEDAFRRQLAQTNYISEWIPMETNKRITTFDSENSALVIMSYIAPAFLLLVSSLTLSVVLSRMLKKEYTYIGTLSALGYKKREIFAHYIRIPTYISLTGSVIGLLLGFFLLKPFSQIVCIEYNIPKTQYIFNYWDLVLILLVPLLLNIVTVGLTVLNALRINIVALLKSGRAKEKKSIFIRLIQHEKLPFKTRFKLKELLSNIPRSFLMLFGITTASLFMLTGFLFYSSIDFLLESSFNKEFGYNYQYVYNSPQVENMAGAEPYMMASYYYEKDGDKINFTFHGTPNNAKFIRPKDQRGNYIDCNKTIITKSVVKRMGWEKGDTVTAISNADLSRITVKIDEICDIRYSDYVYIPLSKLNSCLGLDKNAHIGVYSDTLLDIDSNNVSDILTSKDTMAGLEASIASFRTFLYILGFVSGIISFIVVYIVSSMLIEESRKSISILKVMGYNDKSISKLLLNSNTVLVWLGFFVSIPLTLGIINRFFDVLTANMFFDFQTKLIWWHGLISFIFVFSIYRLTLIITKKKILNINMAESLKAKE